MRSFVFQLAVAAVLLTLGACADSPTGSEKRAPNLPVATWEAEPDCVVGGVCLLPPERGGWCDPYLELDWSCDSGGGDCMYSSDPGSGGDPEYAGTMGCPIGDGGGRVGDGGGTAPPPTTDPYKQYVDDLGWDCPGCGERAPTDAEKNTMEGLLPQVQCADGKNTLSTMLGNGSLMVFTADNQYYGAWDSNTQRIYISRPKHWPGGVVDGPELIDSMVHEVVHKLLGHVNGPQVHDQAWRDKMEACGFPQSEP